MGVANFGEKCIYYLLSCYHNNCAALYFGLEGVHFVSVYYFIAHCTLFFQLAASWLSCISWDLLRLLVLLSTNWQLLQHVYWDELLLDTNRESLPIFLTKSMDFGDLCRQTLSPTFLLLCHGLNSIRETQTNLLWTLSQPSEHVKMDRK